MPQKKDSLQDFHAERLQTLGMLAGGVAHDFNNILAGILGHTTYLKTILPKTGPHSESLVAIEEGAKKASLITQQILNFSKLDATEQPVKMDLCALTTRTCSLLRGAISPEFIFEYEIPPKPIYIWAVEARVAQLLVNLVINSRDALEPNGYIRVSMGPAERPRVISLLEPGCRQHANYVEILVTDNGRGMSSDVMQRAFEPYFSTKKDKGTGLGLATVDAIVKLFDGGIKISSKVDVGTTVSVYLPIFDERSMSAPQDVCADDTECLELEKGSERILVVDDEYPVRNVLSLSLEHLGYKVEIASSGVEAIEKFSGELKDFDLVILDMLMPNLSGEEVFFRLQELHPDVRVLVISGYSSEDAVKNILEHGGRDFIQKPFTIGELSKKVRECLGTK